MALPVTWRASMALPADRARVGDIVATSTSRVHEGIVIEERHDGHSVVIQLNDTGEKMEFATIMVWVLEKAQRDEGGERRWKRHLNQET